MNPLFTQIIQARLRRENAGDGKAVNADRLARFLEVEFRHAVVDLLSIFAGALVAAFGLRSFLLPSHFLDGGVTGIALIVHELSSVPLSALIIGVNVPFLLLGYRVVSGRFALKSLFGVLTLGLAVYVVPFPVATRDPLLVAAFGGCFLGLGIGLAIRGGGILDGTEVLAIAVSRRTALSVGNAILVFNVLIFAWASWVFSLEIGLYAVLTYLGASKTVDFVIDGVEEYVGITIVSPESETVRRTITETLGRACTIFEGRTGYGIGGRGPQNIDIIYTVITRLELARFRILLDQVDPKAFVVMTTVKDAHGGMLKKKPLQKLH